MTTTILTMTMLLLVVTESLIQPVQSATVSVSTAQQLSTALQSANAGDEIVLDSSVTFTPTSPLKGVSLASVVVRSSGLSPATIDCSNVHGDFCMRFGSSDRLTLLNILVTKFGNDGGLMVQTSDRVTITDVSVTQGSGYNTAGMTVSDSSNVIMKRLSITNNANQLAAAGLQLISCTSCTLSSSVLANNQAVVLSALSVFQSSLTVTNTTVAGNSGIGNCKVDGSAVDFQSSTFTGNAGAASSVCDIFDSSVRFIGCSISGNTGTGGEGVASMINIVASNATFQCSNISGNTGTAAGSPASLINFVGQGPKLWPDSVACSNGYLFHLGQPLNIACGPNPPSTLVLLGTTIFDGSNSAPAIRLEQANVVGVAVQLSSPQPLLLTNSSFADFSSPANRIRGSVQCTDSVHALWGTQVCGSSACACGSVAGGSPSLTANPDPAVCTSTTTVVVPTSNGTIVVTGPTGTNVEPTENPDPSAPVISPVVNVTVNGTGGPVGPVIITLPFNCSQEGFCLAYFDVNRSKWLCVDKCLDISRKGETCYATGETPHLTSFALLLSGDVDACGRTDRFYQWASITALCIAAVLCLLIIVLFGYIPRLSNLCLGEEGTRVKKLRKHVAGLDDPDMNREEIPAVEEEV